MRAPAEYPHRPGRHARLAVSRRPRPAAVALDLRVVFAWRPRARRAAWGSGASASGAGRTSRAWSRRSASRSSASSRLRCLAARSCARRRPRAAQPGHHMRARCASSRPLEASTSKTASTREAVTLACWPPGPGGAAGAQLDLRNGDGHPVANGQALCHGLTGSPAAQLRVLPVVRIGRRTAAATTGSAHRGSLGTPSSRRPRPALRLDPAAAAAVGRPAGRTVPRGQRDAFGVIHDRYRQRLYAYTRQMLAGSRQDAEDALQDVFLRAYGALRADDRPVTLRAWLYRVAHNRCIDQLRRVPPPADVMDVSRTPLHDPLAEAERREDLRRLVDDVRRLPEQQRSALLMRELEGLSYAELAGALGVTVPAVKSLLVRARIGLAEALEARDAACDEVRADLASAHGRGVRSSGLARRHMRDCVGCREYRTSCASRAAASPRSRRRRPVPSPHSRSSSASAGLGCGRRCRGGRGRRAAGSGRHGAPRRAATATRSPRSSPPPRHRRRRRRGPLTPPSRRRAASQQGGLRGAREAAGGRPPRRSPRRPSPRPGHHQPKSEAAGSRSAASDKHAKAKDQEAISPHSAGLRAGLGDRERPRRGRAADDGRRTRRHRGAGRPATATQIRPSGWAAPSPQRRPRLRSGADGRHRTRRASTTPPDDDAGSTPANGSRAACPPRAALSRALDRYLGPSSTSSCWSAAAGAPDCRRWSPSTPPRAGPGWADVACGSTTDRGPRSRDAMRLARAMTFKAAAAGLPDGRRQGRDHAPARRRPLA